MAPTYRAAMPFSTDFSPRPLDDEANERSYPPLTLAAGGAS
jgi:hypothetical protein